MDQKCRMFRKTEHSGHITDTRCKKVGPWSSEGVRGVASLTIPGGQEFHFHFSSNFYRLFLFFPKFSSFSSSFWPSGWATCPPGKALATPLGGVWKRGGGVKAAYTRRPIPLDMWVLLVTNFLGKNRSFAVILCSRMDFWYWIKHASFERPISCIGSHLKWKHTIDKIYCQPAGSLYRPLPLKFQDSASDLLILL